MTYRALLSLRLQLALTAVLITVLALFWLLVMTEERSLLHDQAGKIQEAEEVRDRLHADTNQLESLLDNYRHNMDQIQHVRDHFLRQKDERVVAISDAIAELAGRHNIVLNEVKYDVSQSRNRDLDMYRATFPLLGRYRDIRKFIHDVENSGLFVVITRLEVEESQTFRNAIQANLTLATYFEGERR